MNYIKEVIAELKKTTWLTPKQWLNLVVYTVAVCGIIALLAFVLDAVFMDIRQMIL